MTVLEGTKKITEVSVWLFGKPTWEMEIQGRRVDRWTAEDLEVKGRELHARLQRKAQIVRNLLLNGWRGEGGLYDLSFYKRVPIWWAMNELAALGVDPNEVIVEEYEDDTDGFPWSTKG